MTRRLDDHNARALRVPHAEPIVELLKLVAHPQRLTIVCALLEGDLAVSELERELDLHQPSLSQHLATLREAGVIVGRRRAKAVIYHLRDHRVRSLIEALLLIFRQPRAHGRRPEPIELAEGILPPGGKMGAARPLVGDAAVFARIIQEEG